MQTARLATATGLDSEPSLTAKRPKTEPSCVLTSDPRSIVENRATTSGEAADREPRAIEDGLIRAGLLFHSVTRQL